MSVARELLYEIAAALVIAIVGGAGLLWQIAGGYGFNSPALRPGAAVRAAFCAHTTRMRLRFSFVSPNKEVEKAIAIVVAIGIKEKSL
ncbi:hypothetical protein FHS26_004811 [Rhizobium pisi]|uniref:Uncharacterized protein n=1 Tax=Rhizobium pisi TaxID=574561 RepID=A0A3R9BPV4_9HYPH|nr:hypothetical protein [Rhizobium pisi]MBB3137052.1 hypothetical protein [Rhizobium pisi]RSB66712.1 hypothetical protein EFD55_23785 [Rhizobium pisi]TCA50084.1 hypothetical protein E0J16_22855 [Rhizobium pisi]